LNVGCGPFAAEGWVNIDRSPNVLLDRFRPLKHVLRRIGVLAEEHMAPWPRSIVYSDACKGLPYPDASAVAIYSSHMLEHLYFDQAQKALREFRRLITPTGILRLALPDSEKLASSFLSGLQAGGSDASLEFIRGLNAHPLVGPSGLRRLSDKLGSSMHRWQPTRALVSWMVADAGFVNVQQRQFLEGDLPDLATVEHRQESFFVEATGPGGGDSR